VAADRSTRRGGLADNPYDINAAERGCLLLRLPTESALSS
jgi:hypothetical protein